MYLRNILSVEYVLYVLLIITTFNNNSVACDTSDPTITLQTVTINVNGCPYEVTFCVDCNQSNPGTTTLTLENIVQADQNCSPDDLITIWEEIVGSYCNHYSFWYQFCQKNVTPCNEGGELFTLSVPLCFQYYNGYNQVLDDYVMEYIPCTEAYCRTEYLFCYNSLTGQNEFQDIHTTVIVGEITCSLEASEVSFPEEGNYSSCFINHTACNPME